MRLAGWRIVRLGEDTDASFGCILLEHPSPDSGRLSGSVRIPASDISDRQCHKSRVSLHRDRVLATARDARNACASALRARARGPGHGAAQATAVTARADPPGTPAAPARAAAGRLGSLTLRLRVAASGRSLSRPPRHP